MSDPHEKKEGGHGHGDKKTIGQNLATAAKAVLLVAIFLAVMPSLLSVAANGVLGIFNTLGQFAQDATSTLGRVYGDFQHLIQKILQIGFLIGMFVALGAFIKFIITRIMKLMEEDDGGHH